MRTPTFLRGRTIEEDHPTRCCLLPVWRSHRGAARGCSAGRNGWKSLMYFRRGLRTIATVDAWGVPSSLSSLSSYGSSILALIYLGFSICVYLSTDFVRKARASICCQTLSKLIKLEDLELDVM